ncbi:tetraacyldisaccharide 4'-kinase [Granulosicoccus antarcticus]|uniref:Tetraacyldisaccharide 4'-kinase n=1 Tax=Granulosicoccus antarcticus IMCC3135 TaxID=1192854 RepID=A0A2Z2P317_9GAMM|nr:tetraacyldisaccharide 4'-kinase [Granulosicoccus antarcticus]ASJ75007.1 Tetraacyldisaccharide 4'-kinase [Granulosicoccus antarcticus IMCC3135]
MSRIEQSWQTRDWFARLLWPISLVYGLLLRLRRLAYERGLIKRHDSRLPVIVVGNLSVGGTGKTPLCATLVERFQRAGWRPAIVSRGYGGTRHEQAYLLNAEDTAATAGDEPVMLYRQTGVPVCVCVNRAAAVEYLAEHTDANLIFSDDGLQHLAMARTADIMVFDGIRGLGNGWLLPAGPLRESAQQIASADLVAIQLPFTGNGNEVVGNLHQSLRQGDVGNVLQASSQQCFQLVPAELLNLVSGHSLTLDSLRGQRVHAVAGIGNPQRFFNSLEAAGLLVEPHPLPDHHEFTLADVSFSDDMPVLVTAKDAVKLTGLTDLPHSVHEVRTRVNLSVELAAAIDNLEQSLRE